MDAIKDMPAVESTRYLCGFKNGLQLIVDDEAPDSLVLGIVLGCYQPVVYDVPPIPTELYIATCDLHCPPSAVSGALGWFYFGNATKNRGQA